MTMAHFSNTTTIHKSTVETTTGAISCCTTRKWTSISRLIVFAIGVHLFFSALLVTELHENHNRATRILSIQQQQQQQQRHRDDNAPYFPSNNNDKNSFLRDGGAEARVIRKQTITSNAKANANVKYITISKPYQPLPQLSPASSIQNKVPAIDNEPDPVLEVDDLYVAHLQNITDSLQELLDVDARHIVSCRWRQHSHSAIYSENCNYHLQTTKTRYYDHYSEQLKGYIVLFNPLEQERILCDGSRIGPASIRVLDDNPDNHDLSSCLENPDEPPHLFPQVPSLDTKQDMDPIQLQFRPTRWYNPNQLPNFPCDVPCKSDEPAGVVSQRRVRGTPWSIQFSMEGPHYYGSVRYNPKAHKRNQFYSTTSFQSEIPLPYFSWKEYGDLQKGPAVNYDDAIKGAVFMAKNCFSRNNRERLAKTLIDSDFRVDSVSKCWHNAEPPNGTQTSNKKEILQNYLFYLAFENQCENDYITEKLWLTLESGVVPVYYGSPNVELHAPPHSVINANAFNTTEDLLEYLHKVANNKTLYESYHAWRTKPLPESFVQKYNFTRVHSTCRTCRWAFSKKYGLGWDHESQTIQDSKIPRKTCHDVHGILTHPFQETWLSSSDTTSSSSSTANNNITAVNHRDILITTTKGTPQMCGTKSTTFQTHIQLDKHTTLTRTVRNQDGITDIVLRGSGGGAGGGDTADAAKQDQSIILQMKTSITGDAKSSNSFLTIHSDRHYWFQDSTKRMTILTSRSTEASNTDSGILELTVPNVKTPIQIRVIVEDIDTFYEDAINRTNYFGRLMTEDFLNPLEKFVVFASPTANHSDWNEKELTEVGLISAKPTEAEMETDDEFIKEEMERKKSLRAQVAAIRQSLIKIKDTIADEAKMAANLLVREGIKKLISAGIIEEVPASDKDDDA